MGGAARVGVANPAIDIKIKRAGTAARPTEVRIEMAARPTADLEKSGTVKTAELEALRGRRGRG